MYIHAYVYVAMSMWLVVETDDSVFDMSQSLEGVTVTTVHDITHPTHEEATALNQVTNDISVYYSCILLWL